MHQSEGPVFGDGQGPSSAGTGTVIRHSTGPRTPAGKEASKHNAAKHGIFSSVVVLKGESREEYESLLNGLRDALQPEGRLEGILVEKLAGLSWRYRRLLMAEGAEIQMNTDLVKWTRLDQARQEAGKMGTPFAFKFNNTLMSNIQDPDVFGCCLKLLGELRQGIETGFDKNRDTLILEKLYGKPEETFGVRRTLYEGYMNWFRTAELTEDQRQREQYVGPEQCKQYVLFDIDTEIERLKNYKNMRSPSESERTKLEILRRKIPDSPVLDHLLRYEANLERGFDRTLNQLERWQRMRRGQPVAPRIDVNLSTS